METARLALNLLKRGRARGFGQLVQHEPHRECGNGTLKEGCKVILLHALKELTWSANSRGHLGSCLGVELSFSPCENLVPPMG